LRVPVVKTMHDSCEFLVRVDRTIGGFFIFQRSVGIYCCFYTAVSFSLGGVEGGVTYFAVSLDSSFDRPLAAYHMVVIDPELHVSLPSSDFYKSGTLRKAVHPS
jgi:hypothetical protein